MFSVGFMDDLKFNIKPTKRLVIMVLFLFLFIFILPIKILNNDIPFLIPLMSSHALFDVCSFMFFVCNKWS